MFNQVVEFHKKFGLEYKGEPRVLPQELKAFRIGFLYEEANEYATAVLNKDMEGQLDALVDLVYVAMGTAHLQGFDFNEAFRRVHEANMKKIRTKKEADSKRNTSFDVVKPKGWTAPDLSDLCRPTDYAIVHNNYSLPVTATEVAQSEVGAVQLQLNFDGSEEE